MWDRMGSSLLGKVVKFEHASPMTADLNILQFSFLFSRTTSLLCVYMPFSDSFGRNKRTIRVVTDIAVSWVKTGHANRSLLILRGLN